MGAKVSRTDFEWVYTEEPHASRRKIILEKYPQIKKLFGYDPNFKWVVMGMVFTQLLTLPLIPHLSWPMMMLMAYCFGGVINHSLMLVPKKMPPDDGDEGVSAPQTPPHKVSKKKKRKRRRRHRSSTSSSSSSESPRRKPRRTSRRLTTEDVVKMLTTLKGDSTIHEISHNLAFGHARPMANRWFGFFANLPIGIPTSISFKKYHLEHHRYQGNEVIDTDLPTLMEAKLFNTTFGKLIWLVLQPLFYTIRPLMVRPKPPEPLEAVNLVIQLFFDAVVVQLFGWRTLFYLIIGSLLAMGVHPVAGHFISEHYMFKKGYETYSYYGALNFITFNVGYHMEHHDFPAVPGSRLPEVKRIAPEFYDDLPQHTSWTAVLYDFVMDPDIGPYARIKRKQHGLES